MAASVYNLAFFADTVIELTDNFEDWPTRASVIATVESSPDTVQGIEHFSVDHDPHASIGSGIVNHQGSSAFMPAVDRETYKSNPKAVYYHVRSDALIAASPVFRDILVDENCVQTEGVKTRIYARGLNARALMYVLAIFHNRLGKLPEDINIHRLAHVAVVVDALRCQEAVLEISTAWCDSVKDFRCVQSPKLVEELSGEYLLWLWVTYVFRLKGFKQVTEIILRRAEDKPLLTVPGLPIDHILAAIAEKRKTVLEDSMNHLSDWVRHYTSPSYKCELNEKISIECGSVMAASLRKNIASLGIKHRDSMSYPGDLSIQKLCSGVVRFQEPKRSALDHLHSCSFKELKNSFVFHTSALDPDDVLSSSVVRHVEGKVTQSDLPFRLRFPTAP